MKERAAHKVEQIDVEGEIESRPDTVMLRVWRKTNKVSRVALPREMVLSLAYALMASGQNTYETIGKDGNRTRPL